jgi:hypothetical protein
MPADLQPGCLSPADLLPTDLQRALSLGVQRNTCGPAWGFARRALASRNAMPSRNAAAMLVHASSAVTSSSMMCPEHIATRRVEIDLPPMNCAA